MSSEGPELKAGALYKQSSGYPVYVHDVASDGSHLAYSFLDSLEDVSRVDGVARVFVRSEFSVRGWTLVDENFNVYEHLRKGKTYE